MTFNSRVLSLIFASCVAIVVTISVSFLKSIDATALLIISVASFAVAFVLSFVALEFLVLKDVRQIHTLLDKLRHRKQISFEKHSGILNEVGKINEEILELLHSKQKEIDELKKLEAFRKEFVADVSHELKTPIFAAQGFIHTLLDGAVKDKAVRGKFLRKSAKSLDRLDVLVQDLLTLSQIETGQIKMHFEKFDLYALTEEVIDQLEDKAEKRDIRLKIEGPSQKITVFADRGRISQVMTNLISNAIKHSHEGGKVEVSFEEKKKMVHVEVKDYGEGIPAEHLSRIFERFYRVDKSRSREKGGTGLGLAIVKHILENHGTKAEVESAPGKGSSFSFKLPHNKPNGQPEGHKE